MNFFRISQIAFIVFGFTLIASSGYANVTDTSRIDELKQKDKFRAIVPLLAFNDNDGLMIGISYINTAYLGKTNWQYVISPFYGFKSNNVVGQAWVSYTSDDQQYTFRVGSKSFHKTRNRDFDYVERYTRFDPSITYHFGNQERPRELEFKFYVINNEEATFSDPGVFDGKSNNTVLIPRIEYRSQKLTGPSDVIFDANVEAQWYNYISPESYVKATASFQKRWEYKPKKSFYLRLFGSGFLHNTQRRSTAYQNIFTQGSISLIQQGYNDYAYDEYFFSRENQFGFYDNQISMRNGGGFKTAIGSSYNYGMSNNMAFAVNTSVDAPMEFLPIAAYFDLGMFSVPLGIDKWQNKIMYNGGLSIKLVDVFAIHIPIVYSKDLSDIHKSQHDTFLKRISFSLDLHQTEWWKRTFRYRNKW